MNYSEKLKDPRWQKKRLEIFQRDNWTCVLCGDSKSTLNVHHKQYTDEPWDAPNEYLETYCEGCHFVVSKAPNEFLEPVMDLLARRIENGLATRFIVNPERKK